MLRCSQRNLGTVFEKLSEGCLFAVKARGWVQLQNREWGGGYGSPYKGMYVPGKGWVERVPEDLDIHKINADEITDPWIIDGSSVISLQKKSDGRRAFDNSFGKVPGSANMFGNIISKFL